MHIARHELEDDLLPDHQTLQEFDVGMEPLFPSTRSYRVEPSDDFDVSPEMNAHRMESASHRFIMKEI